MSGSSIRIGKVFGIELRIDYTWFLIFALITFLLSFSIFPQLIPGLSLGSYIIIGAIASVIFFLSVLFHELMHSLVAQRNGIAVRSITLLLFGGVSQIESAPQTPGVEFKMALAGPLSSIVLGAVFVGLYYATRGVSTIVAGTAFWLGYINIILGIFNLLPGFPLDGGRVLRATLWYFTNNLRQSTAIAAGIGRGIAYTMIFVGLVGPFFTGNFSLIWFILLGWYLLRAAQVEYQEVVYHEALKGVTVGSIMTPNPITVDPHISIEELAGQYFSKHNWVAYPVAEHGAVEGIVTTRDIANLPRDMWKVTQVSNVMRPMSLDIVTSPDTEVFDLIPAIATKAGGQMLVMKDNRLVGIITVTDIDRAIVRILHLQGGIERPAA
ncbi:MAG TPA: site-2 protease family protein [Candidatus Aquicultor sp.]|jgi:Zn-dependent protease/CBS domain-containing protein